VIKNQPYLPGEPTFLLSFEDILNPVLVYFLPDEFTDVKCIEPCPYGEPYFLVSILLSGLNEI
jgi:hypothetical protein